MTSVDDELDQAVHFRNDPRWTGVEIRGYVQPELEIMTRAKGGDGRTISGILVPYGVRQRITDNLEEMFRRGSSAHQLRAPNRMKLAREHIRLGGTLIGRALELRDDAAGLWGALRAAPGVRDADETIALVEAGALDELSIGFRARQHRTHPDGLVERTKVDILETAVVIQGAYGRGARITEVRSRDESQEEEPLEVRTADELAAQLAFRRASRAGRIAAGRMIR